jgi:formylglycine-generating enzyme required for sulfatase activity
MRSIFHLRCFSVGWVVVAMIGSQCFGGTADKEHPFVNSLGMRFVPVAVSGGKPVLFSVWKTRVKDFEAFAADAHYDATKNMYSLTPKGQSEHDVNNWKAPGFEQSELNPVCGVSYLDGVAFCAWLSKKEGKNYRLPTDHEWSCAVGIGDKERAEDGPRGNHLKVGDVYPWGKQWPPPKGAGNYCGEECHGLPNLPKNYKGIAGYRDGYVFTAPVGSFDANSLGLYDIGGNLWEWCGDLMDPDRKERMHRVLRGGSWGDELPACLLSSFRKHDLPDNRGVIYGFRVVLEQ